MGKVYLVGAGPGDPELITVKGLKAIKQADVILYDRLVNRELLDYATAGTKLFYCGKDPNRQSLPQSETNKMLVSLAKKGHTVTRLKGGDPFVFGRGGEEAEILAQHHIAFEIIPGITAGIAATAYAGIPVTHRDFSSSVAFVTAVNKPGMTKAAYWEHLAHGPETLCIYMGVKRLSEICGLLIKYGKPIDTPVALIHLGTTAYQQTVTGTLSTITEVAKNIKNPAMIVIGQVVQMHDKIQWFTEQTEQMRMDYSQVNSK